VLGADGAVAVLRRRAKRGYDPELTALFCGRAARLFASLDVASVHDAVLAAEPGEHQRLEGARLDTAIRAIGEFADMKSRYTPMWSTSSRRSG
jgi:hypothetical protein